MARSRQERLPRTVRQGPVDIRMRHRGGSDIKFLDLPDAMSPGVAKAALVKLGLVLWPAVGDDVAIENLLRPLVTGRDHELIQTEVKQRRREADQEIRRAEPPQTHAGRAQSRDFIVARVMGQGVEQSQQQGDGQGQDQEFRGHCGGIFHAIQRMQFALLHMRQFGEEKK